MTNTTPMRCLKTLASGVASATILLVSMNTQAAISQGPLSLTVGVPPNMILTLDDSGSMREAFTPESIDGERDTRRAKAAIYNTMYYNPAVTYTIPKKFDATGTESGSYSTSFTNAYYNGFQPALGGLDLSKNYRASWWYKPRAAHSNTFTDTDPDYGYRQFADNPEKDFSATANITSDNQTKTATSSGGIVFSIKRTSSSNCTATATGYSNVSCSRISSNNYKASLIQTGVPAYYYNYNPALAGCTGSTDAAKQANDNCYELKFVTSSSGINGADERQNFAIWYSFYRNRALATMSAARIAFTDLSPSVRLTWQSLNKCTSLNGTATGCGDNKFREYSPAQRGRFFSWLDTLDFYSGTPLRTALDRAGKFLQTDTAWHKYPNGTGNTTENTYACRPSYHVLMTDGIWNGSNGSPSGTFQHDGTSFTLPDSKSYASTQKPYADTTNNTLADLAMHYWATDLKTTLPDKLSPFIGAPNPDSTKQYWDPRNDPANWQHMVNFTMGLGLTRALSMTGLAWGGSTFAGVGYTNLVSGDANWPAAASDSDNNVYDLWHTAINSRGEFFSVDSPDAMVQAFTDILSRITARTATASRPAINSSMVTEAEDGSSAVSSVSYQTSYSSEDNWSGDLVRSVKTRAFNAVTGQFEDTVSEDWKASEKVPSPNSRSIYIPNESAGSGLQAFTWPNAGDPATAGTLANYLNRNPEAGNVTDNKGEQRLNYLRGDRSLEGTEFRRRSSVLSDFYSSTPVSVFRPRYLIYRGNALEPDHPTAYTTFAESIKNRTPRIYVGGNGGMLHGFNAETGVEEFAFIPKAVFPTLNKLTGNNYNHHFYVDGSPVVADVFNGTEWRTILVGTLRAGGKSVFALDITTPGSETLLWEFDDSQIPDGDVKMGYSFSKPTIAKLPSGWAVVFGNGYEADGYNNGKAALFVLDAMSGDLLKSLEVSGTVGQANGLSTPKLSDYNEDGIAEFAYAGDLQGNLWRFNLHASNANSFNVAYGARPMFSAYNTTITGTKKAQPITSAPSLVRHQSGKGYLVIFGTGKYFEDTDKDGDKSMAQTVYGIWDKYTNLNADDKSASNVVVSIDRSDLAAQQLTTSVIATNQAGASRVGRLLTDDRVDWTEDKGWLLDLKLGTLDGEMVVEDMVTFGTRTLLFQSLVPNNDPCGDGATTWLYALNSQSGGTPPQNVFGYTSINGEQPSIVQDPKDPEGGLTVAQKPDGSFEVCTGTTCSPIMPDPSSVGRQTWRLIEKF